MDRWADSRAPIKRYRSAVKPLHSTSAWHASYCLLLNTGPWRKRLLFLRLTLLCSFAVMPLSAANHHVWVFCSMSHEMRRWIVSSRLPSWNSEEISYHWMAKMEHTHCTSLDFVVYLSAQGRDVICAKHNNLHLSLAGLELTANEGSHRNRPTVLF